MKKLFQKIVGKLFKKAVSKSVNDVVANSPEVPIELPVDGGKRSLWKFIIQTIISILTAVLTALGASSCVNAIV